MPHNLVTPTKTISEILSLYQLVNLLNQDQVFLREALEKLRAIEANRPEKFQSTYTQATASRALITYWIKRGKLACCDVNQNPITDVDQVLVSPGESGNWADAFDMLDSTMEIKSSDFRSLIFSEEMSLPTFLQESRKLTLFFPYGVTHLSIDECAAIIAEAEYPKNHYVTTSTIQETDRKRRVRQHYWKFELSNACHEEITPYCPENPMHTMTSPMDGEALLLLTDLLNWLSVRDLPTPIGEIGNSLWQGRSVRTLLNAFIDQQETMLERQQEGRYLLEEVAGIICHKFPEEDPKRLLEQLINDATYSALTVYKLGEKLRFKPKSKIGLDGLPSLEVVKEWTTEAHWDDLNEWITRAMPKLPFKFAVPKSKSSFNKSDAAQMPTDTSTDEAPAPEGDKKSYPIDKRDPKAAHDWYPAARYFAREEITKDPSLIKKRDQLAKKVVEKLAQNKIFKRGGRKKFHESTVLKAFTNVNLS